MRNSDFKHVQMKWMALVCRCGGFDKGQIWISKREKEWEENNMQEKENTEVIRKNYDEAPEKEWERTDQTIEFLITTRMLERTIGQGEKVLDIGGGPGRYSLWLKERGCDVTLFDLSPGNIGFAKGKAEEMGVPLKTVCGNAMEEGLYPEEMFDHVLVMGPMYHIFREDDRRKVIENALRVLKPGGKIYVAFINLLAGALYYLDEWPEGFTEELKMGNEYGECLLENRSWQGAAFTEARFDALPEIYGFMNSFGLRQVTGACGSSMPDVPAKIRNIWLCPPTSCMCGKGRSRKIEAPWSDFSIAPVILFSS